MISFPPLGKEDGTKGPMIIEADMGGYFIHRMYVDEGSFLEILYEHCFNRFRPEVRNQMVPATTPLVGFCGEIIWSLGQISLLVKIANEEHSTFAWMNFMVVRRNGHITEQHDYSTRVHNGFRTRSAAAQEGRKELCILLRRNLDIFAWKPADMSEVSRHVAEHKLNIREGCLPVRQKKRGQAPERNKAIYEEVEKLVNVDKAFQKQIGQNLEVYVDDLVIKSRTEQEIIRDMEETFKTLREINIKLIPKKCAFGMREGMFLGYQVNADGLRVCPEKVEADLNLPSPKCLKDVQKLNGKLASLNRFLCKSAEKSLPFFKTLKKYTKKSDYQWTAEAEMAFKQMKKMIAELPIPRTSVKGQILADFIVERPEDDPPDTPMEDKEQLSDPWILFTDGSSCIDGSGVGLIL
ncbi:reverse transcriptase domain-containing protein [Tanacetum coccineum]